MNRIVDGSLLNQFTPLNSNVMKIVKMDSLAMYYIMFVSGFQEDPLSEKDKELMDLKESMEDTQPAGVIVNCCRTVDQVMASLHSIIKFSLLENLYIV